jgi:hypothetical protein
MTAPASPTISYVRQNGGKVRIAWREVPDATDYNIYLGPTTAPTGLEDSVNFTEEEPNGWFVWWSGPEAAQVFIRITALNALAEESGYSNEVFRSVTSGSDTQDIPAPLDHSHDVTRKF